MFFNDNFEGGVFHKELKNGRSRGEIRLRPTDIVVRTPEDDEFRLTYSECQLEMGGSSGHMVFCRNDDRSIVIYCEDRQFPDALRSEAVGLLDDKVDQMLGDRRSQRRRSYGWTIAFLVGCLVVLVGGYYGIMAAGRAAVKTVPISVDQQVGKLAIEQMKLEGPEVNDQAVVAAIQSIVDQLAPHAAIDGFKFHVRVIDAPIENAFALPGGEIVVYTGLIKSAARPEQVAGVLAHEMAHVTLRHGLQRIGQSLGLAAAVQLLLGDVNGMAALGVELLEVTTINSYSRVQETEADLEGVRMMSLAGIDPMGLAEFFQLLKHVHGDIPDAASWIATHPQHEERIAAIREHLAKMPKKEFRPLDIDWDEVLQAVGK